MRALSLSKRLGVVPFDRLRARWGGLVALRALSLSKRLGLVPFDRLRARRVGLRGAVGQRVNIAFFSGVTARAPSLALPPVA